MAKIKHIADPEQVYGEGDWRSLLGQGPRKAGYKLHLIGKGSIESKLVGVILPSFDLNLDTEDKAFFSSVAPCWTPDPDPKLKRHFVPNGWFMPLIMYPFLGESKEHWISPKNLANMIGAEDLEREAFADAFDDLNKWVRNNKSFTDAQKDRLLKVKKFSDDPLVPGRTTRIFSIGECKDKENDWHPALIGYTGGAHSYLLEQMRWRAEDDAPARDPEWPRYMLGDPTKPSGALVWHCEKMQLDAKDTQDTNVMCFTQKREFLDDKQEVRVITPESLAARFVMQDPSNWNIPTYEEQVAHMLAHYAPEVTAEMIQAACGHRCATTIPDQRKHRVISNAPARDEKAEETPRENKREREPRRREEDDGGGDPMAAVTGRLAPSGNSAPLPKLDNKPAPTADKPKDDGTTYWAGSAGGKASKHTLAQLQQLFDDGVAGVKVQVNGKFVLLAESGLVTLPAVVEEEAPPVIEDEAPTAGDEEAPTVGGEETAAASGKMTKAQTLEKLFTDQDAFNKASKELQDSCRALSDKIHAATDGLSSDVPADMIDELLKLMDQLSA